MLWDPKEVGLVSQNALKIMKRPTMVQHSVNRGLILDRQINEEKNDKRDGFQRRSTTHSQSHYT